MSVNRINIAEFEQRQRTLYEFDSDFCISYINYTGASRQVPSQLILTLEKGDERKTFSFFEPEFKETNKNLVSAKGLFIASIRHTAISSPKIEIGNRDGDVLFIAKSCKNITPIA